MCRGIDILVTHGPPLGIGDRNANGEHCGCGDLIRRLETAPPRLHVFGHIHEGRGSYQASGIRFLNVASLDGEYKRIHQPVVVDLDDAPAAT